MLGQILRAIWNIFCGDDSKPSQEQPHHQQPPQQQQHPKPPYSHPTPQHHKPSYPPHKPSSPPHKKPGRFVDQNQVNQQDERYMSLRARANEEGDKMASAFDRSKEAYSGGNGALAKQLSDEGKAHKARMEDLNRQASEWIFVENNKDSQAGEIDLHGLYVKEAIHYTERAVQEARQRGDSEVQLIVGRGLHSPGGAAKIRPAVEALLQKEQLAAEIDPDNAGVLVVRLDGAARNRGMGPDEITRRLQKNDEACVIM